MASELEQAEQFLEECIKDEMSSEWFQEVKEAIVRTDRALEAVNKIKERLYNILNPKK